MIFGVTPDNATEATRLLRQRPYSPGDSYLNNGVAPSQYQPLPYKMEGGMTLPMGVPSSDQEALEEPYIDESVLLGLIAPGIGGAVSKAPGFLAKLISKFGKRPVSSFSSRITAAPTKIPIRYDIDNYPTMFQKSWQDTHLLPPLE